MSAELDAILGERIAALAELERIAHFGSWSFDLRAGRVHQGVERNAGQACGAGTHGT